MPERNFTWLWSWTCGHPGLAAEREASGSCLQYTTQGRSVGTQVRGADSRTGVLLFISHLLSHQLRLCPATAPRPRVWGRIEVSSWRSGAPGKGREANPVLQKGASLTALTPWSGGFIPAHCSSLSELTMFRRRANMILNLCLCVRPRQSVFCVLLLKNSSCDMATQLGLGLLCVLPTPTGTRW